MVAATLSERAPENKNGAVIKYAHTSTRITVKTRLRGRSSEKTCEARAFSIWAFSSASRFVEAAWPPQQHRHHDDDIRDQREIGQQEADIVLRQRDQERADKAAAHRAEPADHHDDQHLHQQFGADRGGELLAVEGPHRAAETCERGAGHEDADEHEADAIA